MIAYPDIPGEGVAVAEELETVDLIGIVLGQDDRKGPVPVHDLIDEIQVDEEFQSLLVEESLDFLRQSSVFIDDTGLVVQ